MPYFVATAWNSFLIVVVDTATEVPDPARQEALLSLLDDTSPAVRQALLAYFAGIGPAPDGDRHALLQHHVIAEQHGGRLSLANRIAADGGIVGLVAVLRLPLGGR